MNTSIFSIFQEETFGVSLVFIPSQILLYNQIFLLSDGRSLALLLIKTPWSYILVVSTFKAFFTSKWSLHTIFFSGKAVFDLMNFQLCFWTYLANFVCFLFLNKIRYLVNFSRFSELCLDSLNRESPLVPTSNPTWLWYYPFPNTANSRSCNGLIIPFLF